MRKKRTLEIDSRTGTLILPWYGAVIGGVSVFTILVGIAFALPSPSLNLLTILLPLGLLGSANFIWLRTKPNPNSKFIQNTILAILFSTIAFRSFQFILPEQTQFFWMLLIITVVVAHTLPLWNLSFTSFIRQALSSSKTTRKTAEQEAFFKYSFNILRIFLIVGFVMTILLPNKDGHPTGVFFTTGFLGWMVAMIIPFSDLFPSSPWEKQEVDSSND